MSKNARRILTLVAIAALLFGASRLGFFELVRDLPRVRQLLLDGGALACVIYVILFGIFGAYVPAMALMVPALVWPPHVAIPLVWTGGMIGAIHGFVVARFIAREWVESRLPARFRRFDDKIEENGLKAVILMRLMFFLIPPTHWALALSKVRLRDYILGTMVGAVPWIVLIYFVGQNVFAWLAGQPPWVWAMVVGIVTVAIIVKRRREAALDAMEES